ncbi:MAG: coproporphyrinogen dehydrogenase HemZ [Oscillospiraceae bacterium]|nr:coproporphyrinogen dehydrogenase HemZ [Oscillospiraceae bacterium]
MKLYLKGHSDLYAVEQLQMQLFPSENSLLVQEEFRHEDGTISALHRGKIYLTATAKIYYGGKIGYASRRILAKKESVRLRRRILQQAYYLAALQVLPTAPPWGAMAGVRPSKLSTAYLMEGHSVEQCDKMLRDVYFVSPDRRRLCIDSSLRTLAAAELLREKDLSLYIGIPFCPSRCSYCSFVSQSIEKCGDLVEPYLDALCREIAETGRLLRESDYSIRTLYIGGGTPTSLSTPQMSRLLSAIREHFDLSQCLEFTVEGGRPDTLDAEKLFAISGAGVGRMSINPQTMNDHVLSVIGRRHTAKEAVEAYRMAQRARFTDINMDLIAGLPDDSPASFRNTLEKVIALEPSNITVHTLALKKGADLFFSRAHLPTGEEVTQMLHDANALLRENGYAPYYLYRQKYSSGSFENVGWCKEGHDCLYNIYMMEELHSILALGAGGMNKVQYKKDDLERFHNPKFPQEYIRNIDDILEKKRQIFSLLP